MTENDFFRHIQEALRRRTYEIAAEEITKANAAVDKRIKAEVDAIALSVLKEYSLDRYGPDLTITVKKVFND